MLIPDPERAIFASVPATLGWYVYLEVIVVVTYVKLVLCRIVDAALVFPLVVWARGGSGANGAELHRLGGQHSASPGTHSVFRP